MSCHTETKCLKNSKNTFKINKLDFLYSQKVTQIEPLANLTCSIYMLCLTQFLEFNLNSYNFEKETNSNCIFINLPVQCQTKTKQKIRPLHMKHNFRKGLILAPQYSCQVKSKFL